VGYDLYAYIKRQGRQLVDQDEYGTVDQDYVILAPNVVEAIPLGFRMALPPNLEAQVRSRSGLARQGVIVPNSPGTIDPDYRGEMVVLLLNLSQRPITINHGDRIAQMVFKEIVHPDEIILTGGDLPSTARGEGGFGSTGK
jgi:dUTP pyrophosphatase